MKRTTCAFCGEEMPKGLRTGALYCHPNCRKAASREKRRMEDERKTRCLTPEQRKTMNRIKAVSPNTHQNLMSLIHVYGKGFAWDCVDIVSGLLFEFGRNVEADEKA